LPFLPLSDGESFAGWSKNSPIEKAVCERRHIIIKKLRHQVITFTEVGEKRPTRFVDSRVLSPDTSFKGSIEKNLNAYVVIVKK